MYFSGGNSGCCQNGFSSYPNYWGFGPSYGCGCNNNSSSYAIILVLFILLVIVIGCRISR